MNTKKTYVVPTMEVVKVETASFLAASGLGLGAFVNERDDMEDLGDDVQTP